MIFTIPNFISVFRVCLMAFAFWYFLDNSNQWYFLILTIVVVSLDAVDGIIARKLNQTSAFGAKLDILADRITELSYWLFFAFLGLLGYWVFAFFLVRGVLVDYLTRKQDKPLGNSWLRSSRFMRGAYGTLKTLSFCLLIIVPNFVYWGINWTQAIVYLTVAICLLRAWPVIASSISMKPKI